MLKVRLVEDNIKILCGIVTFFALYDDYELLFVYILDGYSEDRKKFAVDGIAKDLKGLVSEAQKAQRGGNFLSIIISLHVDTECN
jgi:hypothetical protein